jgi:hypothetical protein
MIKYSRNPELTFHNLYQEQIEEINKQKKLTLVNGDDWASDPKMERYSAITSELTALRRRVEAYQDAIDDSIETIEDLKDAFNWGVFKEGGAPETNPIPVEIKKVLTDLDKEFDYLSAIGSIGEYIVWLGDVYDLSEKDYNSAVEQLELFYARSVKAQWDQLMDVSEVKKRVNVMKKECVQ